MLLRFKCIGAPLSLFGLPDRRVDIGEACPFCVRDLNPRHNWLGRKRDLSQTSWRPTVLIELPDMESRDAVQFNQFRQFLPDGVPCFRERRPNATSTCIDKHVQTCSNRVSLDCRSWHACRLHSRCAAACRHQSNGEYPGSEKSRTTLDHRAGTTS